MTSSTGVDAIARELRFGSSRAAASAHGAVRAPADDARFGFVEDFDAAEQWPDVAYDTAEPAARLDAAMRSRIGSVLDEAALQMGRRVPAALHLVNGQLQRVLLRCHVDSPGTSTSHRARTGACLLTNLHQPARGVEVAMEALTHESIHQLLYRTEQANGNFCDLAEAPTYRSPWSGARLPLHSLVHACFVWFGLLNLWSELALDPASNEESAHARSRIAHCLFGFAFLEDLLDSPVFPAAAVDAYVLATLRDFTATTLRATGAADARATLRGVMAARQNADWRVALSAGLALTAVAAGSAA